MPNIDGETFVPWDHFKVQMDAANRYRTALETVREELAGCLERDAKAFMAMSVEQVEFWEVARHNQTHGYCLDQIKQALNPE